MDYECKLMPINKLLVSPMGIVEPLCTSCDCVDCTNPIRRIVVSQLGINKKHRLYATAYNEFMVVIDCPGYIKIDENDDIDESEEE